MQLPLPLLRFLGAPTGTTPVAELQATPVRLVRHDRARRYVLRVTPDAEVVVTVPRWGSAKQARAFAEQHTEWIAREQVRRLAESASRAWTEGTEIWLRGERCAIAREGNAVTAGGIRGKVGRDGDVKTAVRRAIRIAAREELPARLLELASRVNLPVARVTVRDQRSRWGSCSSRGSIALNWRLLLMPPAVRDYVLWHELMHLRRADHSPAFWTLVEQVCPDYKAAKRWLLKHGPELA
ncbi:MAG: M48 family metallopeptidase [Acidobacteriota bacterium]|nr:M48 family metallopeptidase [Acidobacteriota bacterium]